ncbi:MAG: molybdopterin-guanine dinucleotide biosynthesis protein MobB [Hyphomicrobium sp.]|jgi:molybdopterin-guanine dinucleotide biosynthesis protein B
MEVIGIIGKSGSGKTTLIAHLIKELQGRGFSVSTVKHARAGVSIDKPGKDSTSIARPARRKWRS